MKKRKKSKSEKYIPFFSIFTLIAVVCCLIFAKIDNIKPQQQTTTQNSVSSTESEMTSVNFESFEILSADKIPEYNGKAFITVNNNEPSFDKNKEAVPFEYYSKLDSLGRCGVTFACVCKETMPTSKREDIGGVRPTGWMHVEYDFVDGGSLYNRCHLIGFQLTAENANERNLITGTRYMNTEGMLPFENMVADYVKETKNHVLYSVTPVFKDNELLARGVQMQAYSVEDDGEGICYNIFCYNVQPGVNINYKNGANSLAKDSENSTSVKTTYNAAASGADYILNVKSYKFHLPSCPGVQDMSPKNRKEYKGSRQELIDQGYGPCGKCCP